MNEDFECHMTPPSVFFALNIDRYHTTLFRRMNSETGSLPYPIATGSGLFCGVSPTVNSTLRRKLIFARIVPSLHLKFTGFVVLCVGQSQYAPKRT